MSSNYRDPVPQYIGRTITTHKMSGSAYDDRRKVHQTTIVDASNPETGLSFQCDDGISYQWEDEGQSWFWV